MRADEWSRQCLGAEAPPGFKPASILEGSHGLADPSREGVLRRADLRPHPSKYTFTWVSLGSRVYGLGLGA